MGDVQAKKRSAESPAGSCAKRTRTEEPKGQKRMAEESMRSQVAEQEARWDDELNIAGDVKLLHQVNIAH